MAGGSEKMKELLARPPVRVTLLLSATIFLLIFFYRFEVPRVTHLTNEIQNSGHVPFFGLMALIFLALSRAALPEKWNSPVRRYAAAFGASMALGIALEVSQIGTARSADPWDILRNVAGAILFLCLGYTVDAQALRQYPPRRLLSVPLIRTLAAISFLLLLTPVAARLKVNAERDRAFPMICDFNEPWSSAFLETGECRAKRAAAPPEWAEAQGREVLRVKTQLGDYPRIKIEEPSPNWNGFGHLAFNVYSAEPNAFPIEIKISDYRHDEHYTDRYNREFILQPGANKILIPLGEVRQAPLRREMDMADIHAVTLLLDHPASERIFYVDAFRLEK